MSREGSNRKIEPIESRSDLLEIFEKGQKNPADFRMGLESELIGVRRDSAQAVCFEGDAGIEAILGKLSERAGWAQVRDQGRLISLTKGPTAITLEPGGQLELSGAPHVFMEDIEEELSSHLRDLCRVSDPLGVGWLTMSLQPRTAISEIPWVPKSRYEIMKRYYGQSQEMPLHMMLATASSQGNFDFSSEADAVQKVALGSRVGPVIGAIFANGAVEEGKLNGYASRRLEIWRHTDPQRCGVPDFFVDGSFSFEKYTDHVLDIPMYFTIRSGHYEDRTEYTFRRYLEEKPDGTVTKSDWENHLTTLFPDVRMKDHLEFRTADASDADLVLGLMALWKGLLHDESALGMVLERFRNVTKKDIEAGMVSASQEGLGGVMAGESLLTMGRDLVSIASQGLSRIDRQTGRVEIRFLDPLRDLLDRGLSRGEEIRKEWKGDLKEVLLSHCLEAEELRL